MKPVFVSMPPTVIKGMPAFDAGEAKPVIYSHVCFMRVLSCLCQRFSCRVENTRLGISQIISFDYASPCLSLTLSFRQLLGIWREGANHAFRVFDAVSPASFRGACRFLMIV